MCFQAIAFIKIPPFLLPSWSEIWDVFFFFWKINNFVSHMYYIREWIPAKAMIRRKMFPKKFWITESKIFLRKISPFLQNTIKNGYLLCLAPGTTGGPMAHDVIIMKSTWKNSTIFLIKFFFFLEAYIICYIF